MDYTISFYPRGKVWYARVFVEGEGGADHRFSTGVEIGDKPRVSEREAAKVAEKRAAGIASTSQKVATEHDSLAATAERLLRQKTVDRKRPRWVEQLAFEIDHHVVPYFGSARSVTSIRRADLEAFKAHLVDKGYQPTTVNNALTGIRQILKHAALIDELLESVPIVQNIATDKQGSGRALTREQTAALLGAVEDQEAREWLTFVANTGLRRTEALSIRWTWIDWDNEVLRVPAEYRKGGKPQIAPTPLNKTVLKLLRQRQKRKQQPKDGRVWWHVKQTRYDKARNKAAEALQLGRVRTHDLRHTAGSRAHAGGAAAPEVRDLLGHSTLAMVSRYGHSYSDRLAEVAKLIEVKPAVPGGRDGRKGVPRAGSGRNEQGLKLVPSSKGKRF